jgi:hypothetical protein
MLPDEQLDALQARFGRFASETAGRSALYERLSRDLARRPEGAALLAEAPPAQRRPNLLYAAVHDLLLRGAVHPLGAFYPSVGGARSPDADITPTFLGFVAAHHEQVLERLRTRATQTNEVGRTAALLPGFVAVGATFERPMTLVELGASAGLLLHLDRYAYRFGVVAAGDPGSPVCVAPDLRGTVPPATPVPAIDGRVGIDLTPLDPTDDDDGAWLRACVWPEDAGRLARLDAALEVARAHRDVRLIAGDVVERLHDVLAEVPGDTVPCVLHSATLAYLAAEARDVVAATLAAAGRRRDLAVLSFEGPFVPPFPTLSGEATEPGPTEEHFLLGATVWRGGERDDRLLARAHPHGAWLQWLGRGAAGVMRSPAPT